MKPDQNTNTQKPRVLIVGGGFAGLQVAKALKGVNAEVTLIDKENHHVFQPLLYQVATASLSPDSISAPIRQALRGKADCKVVMAEVKGIDAEAGQLFFDQGKVRFDYLILAAGAVSHYFGNDAWEKHAPGLKSLTDATEIRRRILIAYESAEQEADDPSREAELTFAIVGGGPTGVELSGAIKEIAGKTLPKEYRNIDTNTTRVILVEGGPSLLPAFPEELQKKAKADLEKLGVEVRLNAPVTDISDEGITADDEFIPARNVFWAAGVKSNPLGKMLGAKTDKTGRVIMNQDLSIPDHPNIFVLGDMASFTPEGEEQPLPGVAQVALQMGRHIGRVLKNEINEKRDPSKRPTFKYEDKGSMAIIGKNRAVASIGKMKFTGFFAWILWSLVHVMFLVTHRDKLRVMLNWSFNWFRNSHDARLILGDRKLNIKLPRGSGFVRKKDVSDGE